MKRRAQIDLTEGPMLGHFRTLAIPAALGMIFNTLYNMVDIYFAGRLDTDAQAGLSIGFMVFFVYVAFGFGLGSGTSALVGGAIGAKNKAQARHLAAQAISFAVLLSAALMLLGLVLSPALVAFISEPGPYREAATRYLLLLTFAVPAFIVAYACNGSLQAQGDTKSMTRALFVAFLANIVLNPLLIFGIPGIWGGIGFDGLAISTVISQAGVMAFLIWRVFASEVLDDVSRADFVPNVACFKSIAAQMLPSSFSFQIMIIAGFVVQYALKGFGGHAIAAYGIGLRVEQLVLLPVLGMSSSLLPIAAQNFGAENYARVREAFFLSIRIALIFMAVFCPLLWLGADLAMGFFTDDPQVRATGVTYLHVDSVLLPVYAMLFLINALLQALKRPIFVLWISLYRQGFGVAFFVWLYLSFVSSSVWSVWFGIGTSVVTGLILSAALAVHVSRQEMGGLWSGPAGKQTAAG